MFTDAEPIVITITLDDGDGVTTTSFPLSISEQQAADYDLDGDVDLADRDLWAADYGSTNPRSDGNADGVVNAADYTVWRDALDASPAASDAAFETTNSEAAVTQRPTIANDLGHQQDGPAPADLGEPTIPYELTVSRRGEAYRPASRPLTHETLDAASHDAALLLLGMGDQSSASADELPESLARTVDNEESDHDDFGVVHLTSRGLSR